ncbi:MAG: hypothetical protein ACRDGL_01815, partial [Candidatus Limnocylindrales bacterium]
MPPVVRSTAPGARSTNGSRARSTDGTTALDRAQRDGLGDMDPEAFRRAAHATVDLMADYFAGLEGYPVLPALSPGELRPRFPAAPPEA